MELEAWVVRPADPGDAAEIALLCGQLGYPATPEEIAGRLGKLQGDPDHVVWVVEAAGGRVVGWAHLFIYRLLVADP